MRVVSRNCHVYQLGELLQPTYRLFSLKVVEDINSVTIVASVSWPCGAVKVTVHGGEVAVLLPPL